MEGESPPNKFMEREEKESGYEEFKVEKSNEHYKNILTMSDIFIY